MWNQHIDALLDQGDRTLNDPGMLAMHRALADRLGEHDIVPVGFVSALIFLDSDFQTGVSSIDGSPMPRRTVGLAPIMYGIFQNDAIRLARGAMGDEFADQVDAFVAQIREAEETSEVFPTGSPVTVADLAPRGPVSHTKTRYAEEIADMEAAAREQLKNILGQ
jgi:hypothetical protein